jgi:hypothetical protein
MRIELKDMEGKVNEKENADFCLDRNTKSIFNTSSTSNTQLLLYRIYLMIHQQALRLIQHHSTEQLKTSDKIFLLNVCHYLEI